MRHDDGRACDPVQHFCLWQLQRIIETEGKTMRLTEEKIKAINEKYAEKRGYYPDENKETFVCNCLVSAGVKIGGMVFWDVDEISGVIDKLTILKAAIKELADRKSVV